MGPSDNGSLAALIEELEGQIPVLLQATGTPGLSIAVVTDARVTWTRSFGVANAESKTPVTTDTLFDAASISKTVFAYAVMKLRERGLLDLDAPLTKYTSERWLTDPRLDLVTARHVLSHTSGLQNWRSKDEPLQIHFTPGAQWMYSGEAYSYLQSVVSRLAGRLDADVCSTFDDGARVCATDFDAYMRANVFMPFGMTASGFVWNDAIAGRYAAPHDGMGAVVTKTPPTAIDVARYGSAGGLLTTPTEYARFLVEVLDPKPSDAFRLTSASRDEMIHPQVKVDDSSSWALGWRIIHGNSGDLISHGGDNVGFQNFTAASVERKTGYVIMTNGDRGIDVIATLTNGATALNAMVSG